MIQDAGRAVKDGRAAVSVPRQEQGEHHQQRHAKGGRDDGVAGGGVGRHMVRLAHEKVCNIDFCAGR